MRQEESPDRSKTPGDAEAALIEAAFRHHRQGRPAEAEALYRQALARNPDNDAALMLLGLLLADGPEIEAAEGFLRRYLALAPNDPIACHQIGMLRQRAGDDAGAVAWFERSLVSRPDHAPTCNELGLALTRLGRHDDALAALRQAATLNPGWDEAWYNLGGVHQEMHSLAEAEAAYRQALTINPDNYNAYLQLAWTLEMAHRPEEADQQRANATRCRRFITSPCTGDRPEARILLIGAAGLANLPTQSLLSPRRFEIASAFLLRTDEADATQAGLAEQLPPVDIAFNIIADADRGEPFLGEAAALCRRLRCPVLNPPDERLERTRRDLLPGFLAGTPGLMLPRTRRVDRTELEAMAAAPKPLERPLLVRPYGSHGGNDLARIEHTEAFVGYLRGMPFERYYLTEYCDYRSPDGYFRKYRFIFVDRKVYPYHLAIAKQWMVHYFRASMDEAAWMKAEEEAFLADYRNAFQSALAATVEAIAEKLDLDYGGMDCGITADGRVLLFEANANMLVHLGDAPEAFAYKHRYVPRILDAVERMIAGRIRR